MTRSRLLAVVAFVALATAVYASLPRFKLPVGRVPPVAVLDGRHGVVLASDGSLWTWGDERSASAIWIEPGLGLAGIQCQSCLRRIGKEVDWVDIAVGGDMVNASRTLALKSDGTMWAWGRIPTRAASGNDWKQVALGNWHAAALKRDGTLWAWGGNKWGQLGTGSTNDSPVPVQVGSATNWIKVWAANDQTVAMQSDHSLWSWGLDISTGPWRAVLAPLRVSMDTDWADIGLGGYRVFAIKSNGTLWAWGDAAGNYTGARGVGPNAKPLKVGTDADWQECSSSGWWYQVFRKRDGSFWISDIGPRYDEPRHGKQGLFIKVALPKNVVAFGAGDGGIHGIGAALTADGEVWTWGGVLGQRAAPRPPLQFISRLLNRVGFKMALGEPGPCWREQPCRLRNLDANAPLEK